MMTQIKSLLYVAFSQRLSFIFTCFLIVGYSIFKSHFIRQHSAPFDPNVLVYVDKIDDVVSDNALTFKKKNLNEMSEIELIGLGIRPFIAQRLIKYKTKIKSFQDPDQVKKVYGITENEIKLIEQHTFLQNGVESRMSFSAKNNPSPHSQSTPTQNSTLQAIDPNIASKEELIKIGFQKNLADRLIKYRSAGGKFKNKSDLLKLYGMSEFQYKKIESLIAIKEFEVEQPVTQSASTKSTKVIAPVDINNADIDDLDRLPGIGPSYAKKILSWRDKLGGFVHFDQVLSTYNVPDSVLSELKQYLNINGSPKKMPINFASIDQLSLHPYISKKEAQLIVAYRNQHGAFHKPKDLLKILALNQAWLDKVSPYLDFGGLGEVF